MKLSAVISISLLFFLAISAEAIERGNCDSALRNSDGLSRQALRKIEGAIKSNSPSFITLDSGISIEGKLASAKRQTPRSLFYLQFQGPTRLLQDNIEIAGQGFEQHPSGFGSPIGLLEDGMNLARLSDDELIHHGIVTGHEVVLKYKSGVMVHGLVTHIQKGPRGPNLISFEKCSVTLGDQVLFDPSWGTFDMSVGGSLTAIKLLIQH